MQGLTQHAMQEGIDNSKVVLVCVSRSYVERATNPMHSESGVRKEYDHLFNTKQHRAVPVRLFHGADDVDPINVGLEKLKGYMVFSLQSLTRPASTPASGLGALLSCFGSPLVMREQQRQAKRLLDVLNEISLQ